MKVNLIYADITHFDWLKNKDQDINEITLKKKIIDQQILLASADEVLVGWLRFGFFWDIIPFMNLLFITKEYRNKGIGKTLVEYWESEMKKQQKDLVMTSTQSDETAQHFYRKLGYVDAGGLLLEGEPTEIIFRKSL